jgi:hypothetical protein
MSIELTFRLDSFAETSSPATSASPVSTTTDGAGAAEEPPSIIAVHGTSTSKLEGFVSPKLGLSDTSLFMDLSEIFKIVNFSDDKEIVRLTSVELNQKVFSIDIDLNKILMIFQKTFQAYKKNDQDDQNVKFKFRFNLLGQIEVKREIVKEVDNEYEFASDDWKALVDRLKAKGVDIALDRYLQNHNIELVTDEKVFKEKLRELFNNWLENELRPKYHNEFQLAYDKLQQSGFINSKERKKLIELVKSKVEIDLRNEMTEHLNAFESLDLESLRCIGKEFHFLFTATNTNEEICEELIKRFKCSIKDSIYKTAENNGFIIREDRLEFEKKFRDVDQTNYVINNSLDLYHLLRNTLFPKIKAFKSQEEKYRFFLDYQNLPKAYEKNKIFIQIFETCQNIEAAKVDLKRLYQRSEKSDNEGKKLIERLNKHLYTLNSLLKSYI